MRREVGCGDYAVILRFGAVGGRLETDVRGMLSGCEGGGFVRNCPMKRGDGCSFWVCVVDLDVDVMVSWNGGLPVQ